MPKISPDRLKQAALKTEEVGGGIAGQLSNLISTIESTGSASFRGNAGSVFQSKSAELHGELTRILRALNTMAEHVDAAQATYSNTDSDVASEIRAVSADLGGSGSVISALSG